MLKHLKELAVFAATVEEGSFRGASKRLRLSPSVISYHVGQLETELNVALIYRSTRKLSLTQEGAALYQSAKRMLEAAEEGLDAIAGRSENPIGRLSITLPAMLTQAPIMSDLAAFASRFPNVQMTLDFSDRPLDLIDEQLDLAIRVGPLPDSGLKARRLYTMDRRLVASPSYLQDREQAVGPGDLVSFDWIALTLRPGPKRLIGPDGQLVEVPINSRLATDSVDAMFQLAVHGLGLATPPVHLAEPFLQSGELFEVLPGWQPEPLGIFAVWPSSAGRQELAQKLVEHLHMRRNEMTSLSSDGT